MLRDDISEKKTTLRDVHNMVQPTRSEGCGDTSDATRAEYVLRAFVAQEKGHSASIFVYEDTQKVYLLCSSLHA